MYILAILELLACYILYRRYKKVKLDNKKQLRKMVKRKVRRKRR